MLVALFAFAIIQTATNAVVGNSPETAIDLNSRAATMLASGDGAGALLLYQQELRDRPGDVAAENGLVKAAEKVALDERTSQDMHAAVGTLLAAQKLVPDNPQLLFDLGVLEDQVGLFVDADATVTHLQQLTPEESKVIYLAARVKMDEGQLTQAQTLMNTYLQQQPDDASAHYGMGRIYQLQQIGEQARAEFEKSLRLKPEQTESHYQLEDMAVKAGQFEQGIVEARKVLARNPQHGGALTDLGIAYFRMKNYEEAAKALEQAVTAAPEFQTGHYYLGLSLAKLGRKQESDEQLALASKMADDDNAKSAQRLRLQP